MRKTVTILLAILICFSCRNKQKQVSEELKLPPLHTDSVVACVLSQVVYCNHPQRQLDSFLPGWKMIWNPQPINGNYAFVARKQNTLAIAIRGSLMEFSEGAFQNWVYQDLNALHQTKWTFTQNTGAKISDGAFEGWQNLTRMKDAGTGKTLETLLDEAITKGMPVLVTGHSLGGNLATVFASWLNWNRIKTNQPKPDLSVITFGAPAAGNAAFADDFNQLFPTAQRYENINDMVPKFPSTGGIKQLGSLFADGPTAKDIRVGYKGLTITLSTLFGYTGDALRVAGLFTGFSDYQQPNGKKFTGKLSVPGAASTPGNWFAEAGYQHSIQLYAVALGAPVVTCIEQQ